VSGSIPPAGYARRRLAGADVVAPETTLHAVERALSEGSTLAEWAEARAEGELSGGRGPAWRAEIGGAPVAIRHYRRGGWMGPLLGDRYFDRPPRPFAELAVSEALRAADVRTPRILAAIVYRARPGYRGDLATEWLTPGLDLAELLRPGLYPPAARAAALEAAGETVGRAWAAGLDHADLRPRNLFLRPRPDGGWDAWLLDLDRARLSRPGRAKKKTSPASAAPSPARVALAA
jgi:3-deoxy-D-manno-octulosonic acid kinase